MLMQNPSLDFDLSSSNNGHTPLTIACMTGNYEIVRLLIENYFERLGYKVKYEYFDDLGYYITIKW